MARYLFGDPSVSDAPGTTPATMTEQGITFTFSAFNLAQVGTINSPGPDTVFGNEGFAVTALRNGGASLTLNGGSFLPNTTDPAVQAKATLVFEFLSGSQNWRAAFVTSGGGTVADRALAGLTFVQLGHIGTETITGIKFTYLGSEKSKLFFNTLLAEVTCFCGGTRIATETGWKRVETLVPGERIRRADGGLTTVRWLGRQNVATRLADPARVNPIRIGADALGAGLPERDLCVSPDHAIAIDGVLYNAAALVNGTTITQVARMPCDGFTYYHVETDAHELILAEGVAAETYLEKLARQTFDNASTRETRVVPEMDLPRITSARLLPRRRAAKVAA